LALLKAMGAGLPVLATRVSGVQEVVNDGANGRLVAPGDPEALAHAIRAVMDDPELAAALGAAGRARVMERYTWQSVAKQTAQWYRDHLGETVPHPTPVVHRAPQEPSC
jgi:glycosyltransferase involved in cell wall biosynthesis